MLNVKTSAHFSKESTEHIASRTHMEHMSEVPTNFTPKHIVSRLLIAFCTFIANIIDATSQLLLLTAFLHLDSNLLSTIVLAQSAFHTPESHGVSFQSGAVVIQSKNASEVNIKILAIPALETHFAMHISLFSLPPVLA